MTSSIMPKFSPEMPIHIWSTLAKFHFDWIRISKVIKKFRLGGGLEAPPKMHEGLREIFHDFYLRNLTVCSFFLFFILYVTKNQEKNENEKFVEFPFKIP